MIAVAGLVLVISGLLVFVLSRAAGQADRRREQLLEAREEEHARGRR